MISHLLQAQDGICVDVYFCFRPLDYLIVQKRRSRPSREFPINRTHIQNLGFMFQYQSLRDIEQILEFFEVGVPVYFQISIVIWSIMNRGFHRCRQTKKPDQYTGVQVEYLCPFCKIQLLSQVLEDLLKISMVGDLHIVECLPCPFNLIVITTHRFPSAQ